MKYLKLYESKNLKGSRFKYSNVKLVYSYNGTYRVVETKSNEYTAQKKGQQIIEEHKGFDPEKGYVMVYSQLTGELDENSYENLIYWYGNCQWKTLSLRSKYSYIMEKYIYGLEAGYDKLITNMSDYGDYIYWTKQYFPEIFKKLYFHDPEGIDSGFDLREMGFDD